MFRPQPASQPQPTAAAAPPPLPVSAAVVEPAGAGAGAIATTSVGLQTPTSTHARRAAPAAPPRPALARCAAAAAPLPLVDYEDRAATLDGCWPAHLDPVDPTSLADEVDPASIADWDVITTALGPAISIPYKGKGQLPVRNHTPGPTTMTTRRQLCVVPTSLATIVPHRPYQRALDATVLAINAIQRRGVFLMELFVRRCVQAGFLEDLPKTTWQTLVNKAFVEQAQALGPRPRRRVKCTSPALSKWEDALKEWHRLVHGTAWETLVTGNQAGAPGIQEASKTFHTTLWTNYDAVALPQHFIRFLRQVFGLRPGQARSLESSAASDASQVTGVLHAFDDPEKRASLAQWHSAYHSLARHNRLRVAKFRLDMLALLESSAADVVGATAKRFTLLPHYRHGRGFVTLSSVCFTPILGISQRFARTRHVTEAPFSSTEKKDIRNLARQRHQQAAEAKTQAIKVKARKTTEDATAPQSSKHQRINREQLLAERPTLSKHVRRMERRGWHFPATFKTDGIQIHVPWERAVGAIPDDFDASAFIWTRARVVKAVDDWVKKEGFASSHRGLFALSAVPAHDTAPFTAVDPGIVNVFTGVSSSDPLAKHLIKCPRKAWFGSFKARRRRVLRTGEAWDSAKHSARKGWVHPEVVHAETLRSQHSLKTAALEAWIEALVSVWIPTHGTLERWYGSRTLASARFARSKRRLQHMQRMMLKLAPTPDHVIALGNGFHGQRARRGTQGGAAPIKGLRRFMSKFRRVVLVDEFKTSQRCPRCKSSNHVMSHPTLLRQRRRLRQQSEETAEAASVRVRVNGVSQCSHCHTTWSRDGAACRNIAAVYKAQLQGQKRPRYLSRHRPHSSATALRAQVARRV